MRNRSLLRSNAVGAIIALFTCSPAALAEGNGVKITNIGLHIGGGPNDAKTKAPFKRAIESAFDEFRTCYAKAETKSGTFGVDVLVAAGGGKADISSPRTGMKGDDFRECVVRAFESVVFEKPKRGATRFSYSLRFEPTN